jgi:hypothetical protein
MVLGVMLVEDAGTLTIKVSYFKLAEEHQLSIGCNCPPFSAPIRLLSLEGQSNGAPERDRRFL